MKNKLFLILSCIVATSYSANEDEDKAIVPFHRSHLKGSWYTVHGDDDESVLRKIINKGRIQNTLKKVERLKNFEQEASLKEQMKKDKEATIQNLAIRNIKYNTNEPHIGEFPSGKYNAFAGEMYSIFQTSKIFPDKSKVDLELEIKERNSLFLRQMPPSDLVERMDPKTIREKKSIIESQRDMMHSAKNFYSLLASDSSRFKKVDDSTILDTKHNVLYKAKRDSSIDTSAFFVQYYIQKNNLTNIELPCREFFTTKNAKGEKEIVIIEEHCKDSMPASEFQAMYRKNPETFKKPVEELIVLLLDVDIKGIRNNNPETLFAKAKDFLFRDEKDPDINFDNFKVVRFIDKDTGKEDYKFVLTNIDLVNKPNRKTFESLMSIFPNSKHKLKAFKEVNEKNARKSNYSKLLLDDYDPKCPRENRVTPRCSFTKQELVDRFNESYSSLTNEKTIALDCLKKQVAELRASEYLPSVKWTFTTTVSRKVNVKAPDRFNEESFDEIIEDEDISSENLTFSTSKVDIDKMLEEAKARIFKEGDKELIEKSKLSREEEKRIAEAAKSSYADIVQSVNDEVASIFNDTILKEIKEEEEIAAKKESKKAKEEGDKREEDTKVDKRRNSI